MKNRINILFAIIIGIGFITGCTPIAPVCTSFDSARMLKKGDAEGAAFYSSYSGVTQVVNLSNGNGNTIETSVILSPLAISII